MKSRFGQFLRRITPGESLHGGTHLAEVIPELTSKIAPHATRVVCGVGAFSSEPIALVEFTDAKGKKRLATTELGFD